MPTLATNRKARFDYQILDKYEAGLILTGFEVKAVRKGKISLKGSYIIVRNEEVFLIGAQINPYQPKNAPQDYQADRTRKLLLNKKEIRTLIGKIKERGLTLVPIRVYTKRNRLKLEFGLGQGKKKADKRQRIIEREEERRIGRAMRKKV